MSVNKPPDGLTKVKETTMDVGVDVLQRLDQRTFVVCRDCQVLRSKHVSESLSDGTLFDFTEHFDVGRVFLVVEKDVNDRKRRTILQTTWNESTC